MIVYRGFDEYGEFDEDVPGDDYEEIIIDAEDRRYSEVYYALEELIDSTIRKMHDPELLEGAERLMKMAEPYKDSYENALSERRERREQRGYEEWKKDIEFLKREYDRVRI